ncbi:MAG: hypothetical protein AAGB51_14755 [Planctomycetota bacterium]
MAHPARVRLARLLTGVLAAVLAVAPPARAQTEDTLSAAGSRALARAALLDLRLRPAPTPSDARIARLALEIASDMSGAEGGDPELIRLAIEAAHAAGDRDDVSRLTRELIRVDPSDTVAQLRWITDRIALEQRAEERLALVERFTTGDGARLPASVRSRLSLDGALLARELGREDTFTELLTRAVSLDATNKDAASLAYTTGTASGNLDTADELQLLSNLLLADPSDPTVLSWIAAELYRLGLSKRAQRFHDLAGAIVINDGVDARFFQQQSDVIEWSISGPETIIEAIDTDLERLRFNAQQLADQLAESGEPPPAGYIPPERVAVSVDAAMTRFIASLESRDPEQIGAALIRLRDSVQAGMDQIITLQRDARTRERQESLLLEWQRHAMMMLRGFAIAVAQDDRFRPLVIEDAQAVITLVFGGMPDDLLNDEEIVAWEAMILGEPERAVDLLALIITNFPDALWPRVGYALSLSGLERSEEAGAQLRSILDRGPLSLPSVVAQSILPEDAILHDPQIVSRAARIADDIPQVVDQMATNPGRFMTLRLEVLTPPEPMGTGVLRVRLRNLAPIPLAVGPARPLNTRMLVMGELALGTDDRLVPGPTVADMARRFRLAPREELVIDLRPAIGEFGWHLALNADRPGRARWRVLQGYRLGQFGYFEAGSLCHEAGSLPQRVQGITEAVFSDDRVVELITESSGSDLARIAGVTFSRAARATEPSENKSLATAWASRYPALEPADRAAIVALLPPPGLAPGFDALDELARNEDDPVVLAVHCLARVTDPDDPRLTRALASEDQRVADLAALIGARLVTDPGGRSYVATDAGLTGLVPDVVGHTPDR